MTIDEPPDVTAIGAPQFGYVGDIRTLFSELRFTIPTPDFGLAGVSGVVAGQQLMTRRQFRIGVRYEF